MTHLLVITTLPTGSMYVDRYLGKSFIQDLHLTLAEDDDADQLQAFLEGFRQTGETGY